MTHLEQCGLQDESNFLMNLSPLSQKLMIGVSIVFMCVEVTCKIIIVKYVKSVNLQEQPINLLFIFDQVCIR